MRWSIMQSILWMRLRLIIIAIAIAIAIVHFELDDTPDRDSLFVAVDSY